MQSSEETFSIEKQQITLVKGDLRKKTHTFVRAFTLNAAVSQTLERSGKKGKQNDAQSRRIYMRMALSIMPKSGMFTQDKALCRFTELTNLNGGKHKVVFIIDRV